MKSQLKTLQEENQKLGLIAQRLTLAQQPVSKRVLEIDQRPRIMQALRLVREIAADLAPDDIYYKLKNISEKDLEPAELVLLKTIEIVKPLKAEAKQAKLENAELRTEVKFKNDKISILQKEVEGSDRLFKEKDTMQHNYEKKADKQIILLNDQLEDREREISKLHERLKGEMALRKENQNLKSELEFMDHKLKLYKPESIEDKVHHLYKDKAEGKAVLMTENEFLKKEATQLRVDNVGLQDANRELEREIKALRAKQDRFVEDVLANQRELGQNYERRVQENLAALKVAHDSELQTTRKELKDIYDKQIKFLNQQKEELRLDLVNIKSMLELKDKELSDLHRDNKHLMVRLEVDGTRLKVDNQVQIEELERKTIEVETLRLSSKNLMIENKLLYQQLNDLKGDVFRIKGDNQDEISKLRADKLVLEKQLAVYEEIEKVVDDNILQMGKDNGVERYLDTVPTAKNRRIIQAIELGRKVAEKENECVRLTRALVDKERELEDLRIEYNSVKDLLERTKQPGSYLVKSIEEKERELVQFRKELKKTQDANRDLMQKLSTMQDKYNIKLQELEQNRVKKEEVRAMQTKLLRLIEDGKSNDIEREFVDINYANKDVEARPVKEMDKTVGYKETPSWVKKLQAKFKA